MDDHQTHVLAIHDGYHSCYYFLFLEVASTSNMGQLCVQLRWPLHPVMQLSWLSAKKEREIMERMEDEVAQVEADLAKLKADFAKLGEDPAEVEADLGKLEARLARKKARILKTKGMVEQETKDLAAMPAEYMGCTGEQLKEPEPE